MIPCATWAICCEGTGHTNRQDLQLYYPPLSSELPHHQPNHNINSESTTGAKQHYCIRTLKKPSEYTYSINAISNEVIRSNGKTNTCHVRKEQKTAQPFTTIRIHFSKDNIQHKCFRFYLLLPVPFKLIFSYNLPYCGHHQPTFSREV